MPFSSISSLGQNRLSSRNLETLVTFFSTTLPVYALVFGSHSSRTRVSPSAISKSFNLNSHFFFPEATASKYSGQIFFLITAMLLRRVLPQISACITRVYAEHSVLSASPVAQPEP